MFSTEAPAEPPFGVQHELRDGFTQLSVRGELDLMTASILEDELSSIEDWSDPIVLDLSDLRFMDASGLRTLAAASRRAGEQGRQFVVIGCSPAVRRVFELTGMEDMLGPAAPHPSETAIDG